MLSALEIVGYVDDKERRLTETRSPLLRRIRRACAQIGQKAGQSLRIPAARVDPQAPWKGELRMSIRRLGSLVTFLTAMPLPTSQRHLMALGLNPGRRRW